MQEQEQETPKVHWYDNIWTPPRGTGPVKWCGRCGAKHSSRVGCGLIEVQRVAKSGRIVTRLTRSELKAER